MDPYLEQSGVWNQVHTTLIVDIQRFLTPLLRPRYYTAIEQRTYLALLPPDERLVGIPDALVVSGTPESSAGEVAVATQPLVTPVVAELPQPEEVKERYLEIRTVKTQDVITVIEILSPSNKMGREGREQYERKRLKILGSLTNLVEIDLLRAGHPFPMKVAGENDYRIIISRSHRRPRADAYLFSIRQPVPPIPIPLRPDEAEPELPLNDILHQLYDQGGYDLVINYQNSPEPPLSETDETWARQILA
jgi:hypothetical protein